MSFTSLFGLWEADHHSIDYFQVLWLGENGRVEYISLDEVRREPIHLRGQFALDEHNRLQLTLVVPKAPIVICVSLSTLVEHGSFDVAVPFETRPLLFGRRLAISLIGDVQWQSPPLDADHPVIYRVRQWTRERPQLFYSNIRRDVASPLRRPLRSLIRIQAQSDAQSDLTPEERERLLWQLMDVDRASCHTPNSTNRGHRR